MTSISVTLHALCYIEDGSCRTVFLCFMVPQLKGRIFWQSVPFISILRPEILAHQLAQKRQACIKIKNENWIV